MNISLDTERVQLGAVKRELDGMVRERKGFWREKAKMDVEMASSREQNRDQNSLLDKVRRLR